MNYGKAGERSSSRRQSRNTARYAATSAILTVISSRSDRAPTKSTVNAASGPPCGNEMPWGLKQAVELSAKLNVCAWAGGPALAVFACTIPTEGAPSLRSLQGWAAMLHVLFDFVVKRDQTDFATAANIVWVSAGKSRRSLSVSSQTPWLFASSLSRSNSTTFIVPGLPASRSATRSFALFFT